MSGSAGLRRYRVGVASRALAALAGGYLLAAATAAACAVYLPLPRAEAVVSGALLAYPVYAAAAMACFACRSATRAWAGTLGPAALLGLAVLLPRHWPGG